MTRRNGSGDSWTADCSGCSPRRRSWAGGRTCGYSTPLAGLILNRVHRSPAARLSAARSLAAAESLQPAAALNGDADDGAPAARPTRPDQVPYSLAIAALRLHAERMQLAAVERRLAERFTAAHPLVPIAEVPAQAEDVHDLAGLRAIGESFRSA